MISSEVAVFGANVLQRPCGRVRDLDIAGDVSITVYLAELIERLVCNVSHIQLVIT